MIPKKIAFASLIVFIIVLLCVVTYFFLEGVVSVYRGVKPGTSVTYAALARFIGNSRVIGNSRAIANSPATGNSEHQELIGTAGHDKPKQLYLYEHGMGLADPEEIENLIDRFKASRVGLGNTPYRELDVEKTSTTDISNGCLRHKPNLHVTMRHLNSTLFNPFDPIVAFWHEDHALDPEVAAFISRYGQAGKVTWRTNRFGDRITLPMRDSEKKVIVAGDSVAIGIMLNDNETLASQLQADDLDRHYINTGVAGASSFGVICAVERAVQNYGGSIDELIYIFCENDFDPEQPLGKPQKVVAWLKGFVAKHDVRKVTVIYAPYIYNVMPQLTKFKGAPGYERPSYKDEKARLAASVRDAGFRYIDFTDIALRENREKGSMFAAFGLFVDHVHLSRLGTRILADELKSPEAHAP